MKVFINRIYNEFLFRHWEFKKQDSHLPVFQYYHFTYKIVIYEKGNLHLNLKLLGQHYNDLTEDTIILIPKLTYHIFTRVNDNYRFYAFRFNDKCLPEGVTPEDLAKPIVLHHAGDIIAKVKKLDKTTNLTNAQREKETLKVLQEAIIYIKENALSRIRPQEDRRMADIVKFLDKDPKTKLTNEDISKELGYSVGYLNKIFNLEFNITPMMYRNIVVAHKARIDIINGKSPTDIYEEYGYDNYATFYRQQMSVLGVKPSIKNIEIINDAFQQKQNPEAHEGLFDIESIPKEHK